MQRFYLERRFGEQMKITDTIMYNQITRVLRARVGNEYIFFNSTDNIDYVYKIDSIDKNTVVLSQIEKINKLEYNLEINLYQSLPNKHEKIDNIIQKGVEVGISNFYFYKGERSQKLDVEAKKITRFQKIMGEAVEQSGRNKMPDLEFTDKLDFNTDKNELNLFFHTNSENSLNLKSLDFSGFKTINIFVGPEGGFSDNEVLNFEKDGFKRVNLGENIMRTETVGTVVGFYIRQS
ncbi:MAG: RsmE family RNA methyltransferase [Candidatus Gracilibacteria bacterium]|nr:RsmE family RNA methyltransferase [Candidatus Gracilibacteria bacterium]